MFYNTDSSLLNSVYTGFKKLGYKPAFIKNHSKDKFGDEHRFNKFCIGLFTADVKRFYEEVGFGNFKNNLKYSSWVKNGRVPNNSEIKDAVAGIRTRV